MNLILELFVFAGIVYIVYKNEQHVEKQKALENRLKWTASRVELLTQFICEAHAMREDAKKFIARGFNCSHDRFANDHANCLCADLKGRINSMVDREDFYRLLAEKNPAGPIDGSYLYQEAHDKERARENQQAIFPYLKRLNQIAPKSVTDEHVKWLMRDGIHDSQIARFLGWFLPGLRSFEEINDPEGKKILSELEERLGGETGRLSDAIALFMKPGRQSSAD